MVKMKGSEDKGIFFSLDALLALVAILMVVGGVGVYYSVTPELEYRDKHTEAEDLMSFLSNTKAGEVEGIEEYVDEDDEDKSLLELVGSYWAGGSGDRSAAKNILETSLEGRTGRCWEMEFGNETAGSGCEEGDTVSVASRIASGYVAEEEPEGYVARGHLKDAESRLENSYAFFGGYVGDGDITKNITLENKDEVQNVSMEMDAGGNFTLFLNGNKSGEYVPEKGELRADRWTVDEEHWDNFREGENRLRFNFTGGNKSISGGFFRVNYNLTDVYHTPEEEGIEVYSFPGVEGIINLYSSFYVPGEVENISALLDFRSNYSIFLKLGNTTVYEGTSNKDEEVVLEDEHFQGKFESAGLDYSAVSKRTVPLRMGLSNLTDLIGREADMFSVVDISGSMGTCDVPGDESNYDCQDRCANPDSFCCWLNDCESQTGCEDCDGIWLDYGIERINVAKESTKEFIDIVLNVSGSRAGLNAYETTVNGEDVHNLTRDNESLYSTVDGWEAGGGTCICCGVEDATERLVEQSNESRYRSMVVMSDGEANEDCHGGDPKEEAIQAACDAYENHGIEVYTIGFGPEDEVDEETLKEMADCGNGTYYYSELGGLEEIYENVTEDMLAARYEEQELEMLEEDVEKMRLSQSSYVRFNYTGGEQNLRHGEIPLSLQSDRFGGDVESPKDGEFWIGEAARPLETRVTSYSDRFWTSLVNISNEKMDENVYNLTRFSKNYEDLGDPYTVQIPVEKTSQGNNTLFLDTASEPGNFTGGSPDSRVIYTVGVNASVGYGDSFSKYEGGTTTVELATGETYELEVGNASDPWDPEEDALDNMVERLLDKLDADGDGKIDVRISEGNIEVDDTMVEEIPYLWGPGMFTLKVW
ncbi:MAG: vWA domain-containing protein [Candidatus Aenigmatarchaeota archaeon]